MNKNVAFQKETVKMGGNLSTVKNKAISTIESSSKASCKNYQQVDQEMKNVNVELIGADCGPIFIGNRAVMQADCDMDQFASALAEASMDLEISQAAGLTLPGTFNISSTQSEREQAIRQQLEIDCGNEQKIKQKTANINVTLRPDPIGGTPASCKSLDIINEAELTTACVIKSVSDVIAKVEDKIAIKQTNEVSPLALLLLMIPLIIVGVILYYVFRAQKKKPGSRREIKDPGILGKLQDAAMGKKK